MIPTSSQGDNDDRNRSSPLAAFARSLIRPFRTLFARQLVGRLPVRSVARVSDATSTLFDVQEHAPKVSHVREDLRNLNFKNIFRRFGSSAFGFSSNIVLGTVVYGSYDMLMEIQHPKTTDSSDFTMGYVKDAAFAGLVAGSIHGVGLSCIDAARDSFSAKTLFTPNLRFGGLFHHASAHSILFASFEGFKGLFQFEEDKLVKNSAMLQEEAGVLQVAGIFCAGGAAGQVQHVVSHYTERIETMRFKDVFGLFKMRHWGEFGPLPTVRGIVLAFPGSAFAFLAFEYGKFLVD